MNPVNPNDKHAVCQKEAHDFKAECDAVAAILDPCLDADFSTITRFKQWTINDIIGHLHLWNIAANQTLTDPKGFQTFITEMMSALMTGKSHRETQNTYFDGLKNRALYEAWKAYYPAMAERFSKAGADMRVKWAGPDMSAQSCIIARQMEHWAHAQAIFDVLGLERTDTDRLKNVAHIGVTTYSWSFKVNGLQPILPKPYIRLTAPSGAVWEWNTVQADNRIEGSATEFCQVVTQCRNIADTTLKTKGKAAKSWMKIAQCFAGGPEIPPAKGMRRKG